MAGDIGAAHPAGPPMSLIHTTTVAIFRAICARGASGSLVPQLCPVMGIDLTYFFYGRPAYRPGRIDRTNKDMDSRPVCLVFRKDRLPDSFGVYPCDTGAHRAGMYSPHLDGVTFAELDCSGVDTAEGRLVSRFFETNDDYFYGDQRDTLTPDPVSPIARGFFNFLQESGTTEYDDRSRTIEMTQTGEIDLTSALQGVFLPDFLLNEPAILAWAERGRVTGLKVKTYRPQSHTSAGREVERRFPEIAELQSIPQ